MAPCILNCLQDRTANIRNAAEVLFGEIIEYIGFEAFQPYLKDIKPAVINSLKTVFDKYKAVEETFDSSAKTKSKPTLKKPKVVIDPESRTPRNRGQTLTDIRIKDNNDKEKRLELDSKYK